MFHGVNNVFSAALANTQSHQSDTPRLNGNLKLYRASVLRVMVAFIFKYRYQHNTELEPFLV